LEFCPKCGKMLIPQRVGSKVYLVCPACNYKKLVGSRKMAIISSIPEEKRHKIGVIETESRTKVRKEERETYREEYYSVFLETYAAEEYESESQE